MKFKQGKITFEPDDKERVAKEAEQIQQFDKELRQAASGWVSTKKRRKLALNADKSHIREQQELAALYDTFRENMALTERMEAAELAVQEAAWAFSQAVRALNVVNAQLDRGPAEIADIVAHKCVDQTTLDQSYTAENKRYYTELAAKQHQNHTDERQK